MSKNQIDWNDTIHDFVKIKLFQPQVISNLLKRERECAEKLSIEQKLQDQRTKYENQAKTLKSEQIELEWHNQQKRRLQMQILEVNKNIVKMESNLEREAFQVLTANIKQVLKEEKEQNTLNTVNSDTCINKRQEQLNAKLANLTSLRNIIKKQIEQKTSRRSWLKEQLEDSALILQQHINKKQGHFQREKYQKQILSMQGQLQVKKNKNKQMIQQLLKLERKKIKVQKSKQTYKAKLEECIFNLVTFSKQSKKMLMSNEDMKGSKYLQFLSKYRIYNKSQYEQLKSECNKILERHRAFSHSANTLQLLQGKFQRYEDLVIQVMKKFSNKNFTAKQFTELENNSKNIANIQIQLYDKDISLNHQIESLRVNLERKTKQLKQLKKHPKHSKN